MYVLYQTKSKPRIPHLSPISRPPDIPPNKHGKEENNLKQIPCPATLAPLGIIVIRLGRRMAMVRGARRGLTPTRIAAHAVQILRLERDDVVVIGQLAGFGR